MATTPTGFSNHNSQEISNQTSSSGPLASVLLHLFTVASAFGPTLVAIRNEETGHFDIKNAAPEFRDFDSTLLQSEGTSLTIDLGARRTVVVCIRPHGAALDPAQLTALASCFELARQAAELNETQIFYQRFSQVLSQCYWTLDRANGTVLSVSGNFEKVWGSPASILTGGVDGFLSTVFPGDRDHAFSEFHVQLQSEVNLEFRVITARGEIRWIWLRGFSLSSDQMVLIADDVTEKKTEEEVARKRESDLVAQARMQAIGDLASGVAHEINNPLTIIVGKAAEVQRLAKTDPLDRDVLFAAAEKIKKTSVRISEIVQSLKSLSRPERYTDRRLTRHPLQKVVNELRDFCGERFQAHGVSLILPEIPMDLAAEMNPTLVTQLLLNLLNNGHDAALSEKEKWVRLDWTEDADSIYLYVTDSGSGIPIKIRGRIFDPFFTTKDPGQGTGLGLSLASSIATHHHGSLNLDTHHAHTRFAFQLPKKQPAK